MPPRAFFKHTCRKIKFLNLIILSTPTSSLTATLFATICRLINNPIIYSIHLIKPPCIHLYMIDFKSSIKVNLHPYSFSPILPAILPARSGPEFSRKVFIA